MFNALRGFATRHPGWVGLTLLLLTGTVARIVLSTREGHLWDVNLFLKWMRGLVAHGLAGFYAADASCNYPPLYPLILRGLGELLSRFDPGLVNTAWLRACLRLPACLADLGVAVLLYLEVRRLMGTRAGVLAATLYYLNPVALYNSAYWGQVDSIHSGLVLCALIALNRQRPLWAGAATGLALLQKFQAVVFVPLVLFDVYRWQRWKGLTRCVIGGVLAAALVLAPFAWTRTLRTAVERGYVRVVGQYSKLSQNAFNLWYATGHPQTPDDSVPVGLVEVVAGRQVEVSDQASWLLWLTYRRIAMVLFALAVATVLTLYRPRYHAADRALAAGLLALAFFLCLTEMHERYAYPMVAVLPLWAVRGKWCERAYLLLSILLLLNLTVAQPVDQIGSDLALLMILLGLLCLAAFLWPSPATEARVGWPTALQLEALKEPGPPGSQEAGHLQDIPSSRGDTPGDAVHIPPPSTLLNWFGRLTWAAVLTAAGIAAALGLAHRRLQSQPEPGVLYLGDLIPVAQRQDYGKLEANRSVEGGVIYLGDRYYLRGLGTHAGSTIVYELPEGYRTFRAVAGINRHFGGSARLRVFLDNRAVFASGPLTARDRPVEIELPLDNAKRLKLVVSPNNGGIKGAHVDWALARLEK
ncbi:MAG: NPCBM/NEW2 domain-containing protein [Planctomycetota bacterium]